MRRAVAVAVLCGALGACGLPPRGAPPPRATYVPPPSATAPNDDLKSARAVCNSTYPAQIGSYLAHANCVNDAVERYALGTSRYPDLVRLQEQVRSQISARIDQKTISARDGEQQMVAADKAITAAQHERDAAHADAADQHIARVEAMLNE
jgi:hypothetical protein